MPFNLDQFIRQLMPYIVQQPRPLADLRGEADRLYNPYFDEQVGDVQGDFGTTQGRLNRSLEDLSRDQAIDRGALTEKNALQGLQTSGIGDMRTAQLGDLQHRQTLGLTDSLSDLDKQLQRSLRGINRNRANAIQGYVNDPMYQFPTFNF